MEAPKITPIKPSTTEKKYKKIHPHLPQSNFVLSLNAPRATGKSTLINWLMLHDTAFGQDYFSQNGVYIFSPTIEQDSSSRYLLERFNCDTMYSDAKLQKIIDSQKKFKKDEMPHICCIFDDCIGDASMKRNSLLTAFVTKSRHYNADIIISLQHFKSLPIVIRQNITDLCVGFPIPNKNMLLAIADEYGDNMEGGSEQFIKLYHEATEKTRYRFMYCKLRENPIQIFTDFEKMIYPKKESNNMDVDIDSDEDD